MSNLIKTTKINKNIILDELTKIIIDHTIAIDAELLKQKVNLLYEDCKDISAENFISNATILRKRELFGRLPANHLFLKTDSNQFDANAWKKY